MVAAHESTGITYAKDSQHTVIVMGEAEVEAAVEKFSSNFPEVAEAKRAERLLFLRRAEAATGTVFDADGREELLQVLALHNRMKQKPHAAVSALVYERFKPTLKKAAAGGNSLTDPAYMAKLKETSDKKQAKSKCKEASKAKALRSKELRTWLLLKQYRTEKKICAKIKMSDPAISGFLNGVEGTSLAQAQARVEAFMAKAPAPAHAAAAIVAPQVAEAAAQPAAAAPADPNKRARKEKVRMDV